VKRREAIKLFQKVIVGAVVFSNPYSLALEHIEKLDLPNTPDPLQKLLIETNVEFQLAGEDCSPPDDPCAMNDCGFVQLKNKCWSSGDIM
jgi:hypothetical protein